MDLQFRIEYKKGIHNTAADALSRYPTSASMLAISSCTLAWQENLIKGYEEDDSARQLLTELVVSPENSNGFSLVDGIIRFKGRVWLGNVIQALHSSGVGGHSIFLATYHRIKSFFA